MLPIFNTGTPFHRSSTSNSLLVSHVMLFSRAWKAFCFLLFCMLTCSWCNVFRTFLPGEGRIIALTPPVATTGAAVWFGMIIQSAGLASLAAIAAVARASSHDATADLEQGESSLFIVSIVWCTCICSINLAALLSSFPFIRIASVTFTFMSEFAWHVMRSMQPSQHCYQLCSPSFSKTSWSACFQEAESGSCKQCILGKGKQPQ